MDISAAIVEVASAAKKPLRIIATSRRDVVSALLTLPELQGNKQQAMAVAKVVWDMQGRVESKQPAVRAQFVEMMPVPKRETPLTQDTLPTAPRDLDPAMTPNEPLTQMAPLFQSEQLASAISSTTEAQPHPEPS